MKDDADASDHFMVMRSGFNRHVFDIYGEYGAGTDGACVIEEFD